MQVPAASVLGRRYGYRPPRADHPLLKLAAVHPPHDGTPLPPSSDLIALELPIRDQGRQGSCTGHGVAGWKEINCGIWGGGKVPLGGHLSVAYPYARARIQENTFPADVGASVADIIAVEHAWGIPPEAFMPYDDLICSASPAPDADMAALPYRCGIPLTVDLSTQDNIRAVLTKKPIVIGFIVYSSFELTGADGLVPTPDTTREGILGGHCVVVTGYDPTGWIIRNSWGPGWARGGHCTMPLGYERLWSEAWTTPP